MTSHAVSAYDAETLPALATLLETRRSAMPDTLVGPGPSPEELSHILTIALRVPDHGRLAPWRLILIAGETKQRWLERLFEIAETRDDAAKARVSTRKLQSAPLVVAVVSSPIPGHKIPEWEQQLSAGAMAMNLLNGVNAFGYGANWLTGWHAYDPQATAMLNLKDNERIAGVIAVGSVTKPAPERERATQDRVVSWLEL
ncbi:hypothetical protein MB02_07420 [Croceicoccus estronivorus]|uniref:nitroreductase family protein n=1 Tax=Croceicoccus estronivorus TaxID=1172626 RepID=UPI000834C42E|nr:nitroreductase [Croceicoccus estronivorus]OCC24401.1 hypothetical protein MB02_07420 [Croceicoccus estronivorus]